MKGQGMFRRIADQFNKALGRPVTHQLPDPVFRPVAEVRKRRKPGKAKPKRALPCEPGTITYHDKLVRHFGRRKADGYGECIQRRMMSALPTEQDFDAAVPWAFLKGK